MKVLEDLVAPAVVSDLVSRLISFLISQNVKRRNPKGTSRRLQLLTFKIHAVVEEAQQRDLASNQRLLMWVKELIEGMYLAYYMLDITTNRGCTPVTSSCSFQIPPPAKRPCRIGGEDIGVDQQSAVLRRLEVATADLKEYILLLACCPRIQRPCISSFHSDNWFMFGRLVKREQIISFLLQPGSNLGVLPIVGGPQVGKGTLVKHVCSDERVCGHFAVVIYTYGSILIKENCGEDVLRTLQTKGCVLHKSPSTPAHDRHLIVIKNMHEVVINKEVWANLCESLRFRAPGSKVIVTSDNDSITNLGTVMAIRVKPLLREEYWYFFMSLAFGGNGLDKHPELGALGRQIAAALNGSFFGARVLGGILSMNLNPQFWQAVLNVVQSFHETVHGHGSHFSKLGVASIALKTLPVPLRLKGALQHTRIDDSELPVITLQELLHSADVPQPEEMRIVLWESTRPPKNQHIVVCERLKEHPCVVIERKKRTRQQ